MEAWHIRSETTSRNRDSGTFPSIYNILIPTVSPHS